MSDDFLPPPAGYVEEDKADPTTEKVVTELTRPKNINTMTDMYSDSMLNLTHSIDVIAEHMKMPSLKKQNRLKKELLVSRQRKGRGEMVDSLKAEMLRKEQLKQENNLQQLITK